ncbi:trimeric LpxA-like protein, partial [Mycena rebaudengoi]
PVATIHPSSVIDPTSLHSLHPTVSIGPFCFIGPDVQIGAKTKLLAHVTVLGHTTIGSGCTVYPNATLGAEAQHKLWKGGAEARVVIGDDCVIRENVTVHRSTYGLDRPTRVGNRALLMAGCHVAHDVVLDDDVIIVNGVALAGHVTVGRNAIVAGMAGVVQGVRIGEYAYVAAASLVGRDVLPFSLVKGNRARTLGVNVVGLRRAGWGDDRIREVLDAVKTFSQGDDDGIQKLLAKGSSSGDLKSIVDFWKGSERGVCLPQGVPGKPQPNNKL